MRSILKRQSLFCFEKKPIIQRVMISLLMAIQLSCGPKQSENESTDISESGSLVEWYSIPDAGLLSAQKRGDSLAFTLLVGAGDLCVGEVSGMAAEQSDGTYKYGDSNCGLIFKPSADGLTVEESGDLCDHGAHCSFDGDYAKVHSQKVKAANADVMSWMRKPVNDFSCMLEKEYGHQSEKYPCGKIVDVEYDPLQPNWYEGPEVPDNIVKAIHPLVKTVLVQFEHGDLHTLTVTLEQKMIMQDVQRIFSLPNPYDGYSNEKYSHVMSVSFDKHGPDDKPQFSLNPVFVTSFTLTGFEHMGAGDMMAGDSMRGETEMETEDVGAEKVIETSILYEYRETGNAFTLIDEGGPGPYEFTCTGIADVKTSSSLAAEGSASYSVENITDMEESTTWAEGKSGLGKGEWIEFTLNDAPKEWGYKDKDFVSKAIKGGFVIQTGYAKSPALWKKNSRPIKLKCFLNGNPLSVIQLLDTPDFQSFTIFPNETSRVDFKAGDVIRFEILDVVKGTKDEDACISEFHIEGSCG